MKKKIILLALLTTVCITCILVLYHTSLSAKGIKNGFNRTLRKSPPKLLQSITLDHAHYYFAGWSGDFLYLGSINQPNSLLQIKHTEMTELKIHLPPNRTIQQGQIRIDSNHFSIADLHSLKLYQGTTDSWQASEMNHEKQRYTEFVPIGIGSIVFRVFNSNRSEFIISKVDGEGRITRDQTFLQKQIDGLFCVDGMLLFDHSINRMVYTYFYRNQFICADTSLRVVYRGTTIDTISHARIKVAKDRHALSSPPFIVNRRAVTDGGKLYINSNLKADNENQKAFRSADVIDVYDLTNGTYQESFYVAKVEQVRLRFFYVHSGLLYVLRENRLSVYELDGKTND